MLCFALPGGNGWTPVSTGPPGVYLRDSEVNPKA